MLHSLGYIRFIVNLHIFAVLPAAHMLQKARFKNYLRDTSISLKHLLSAGGAIVREVGIAIITVVAGPNWKNDDERLIIKNANL